MIVLRAHEQQRWRAVELEPDHRAQRWRFGRAGDGHGRRSQHRLALPGARHPQRREVHRLDAGPAHLAHSLGRPEVVRCDSLDVAPREEHGARLFVAVDVLLFLAGVAEPWAPGDAHRQRTAGSFDRDLDLDHVAAGMKAEDLLGPKVCLGILEAELRLATAVHHQPLGRRHEERLLEPRVHRRVAGVDVERSPATRNQAHHLLGIAALVEIVLQSPRQQPCAPIRERDGDVGRFDLDAPFRGVCPAGHRCRGGLRRFRRLGSWRDLGRLLRRLGWPWLRRWRGRRRGLWARCRREQDPVPHQHQERERYGKQQSAFFHLLPTVPDQCLRAETGDSVAAGRWPGLRRAMRRGG